MNIELALKRLGYTEKWLDYGIISKEYLLSQYEEILNSEDKNAEHYRCGAFAKYIYSKNSIEDDEIHRIFELEDKGPDNDDLHANRIIHLIQSGLLSKKQFDSLKEFPEVLDNPISKLYKRTKLLRSIMEIGLESNFSRVKNTTDSAVHEAILDCKDLERHHVEWLAESGGNKRTRNIAKQLLNSRQFRQRS